MPNGVDLPTDPAAQRRDPVLAAILRPIRDVIFGPLFGESESAAEKGVRRQRTLVAQFGGDIEAARAELTRRSFGGGRLVFPENLAIFTRLFGPPPGGVNPTLERLLALQVSPEPDVPELELPPMEETGAMAIDVPLLVAGGPTFPQFDPFASLTGLATAIGNIIRPPTPAFPIPVAAGIGPTPAMAMAPAGQVATIAGPALVRVVPRILAAIRARTGVRVTLARARSLLRALGLTAGAAALGITIQEAASLLAAPAPRRRRGISAADIRCVKRTARRFSRLQEDFGELCSVARPRRAAPRRRRLRALPAPTVIAQTGG